MLREFAEISAVELEEIECPDAEVLLVPLSQVERAGEGASAQHFLRTADNFLTGVPS